MFQRSEWGLLAAIVVVVLLAGALDTQHNYFQYPKASATDVLRQTALLGIFTLGAAIVIIAGGIDLSSGSVIAFSGTVCATILALLAPDVMSLKVREPLGLGVMVAAVGGTLVVGFLIGFVAAVYLVTRRFRTY